MKNRIQILVTVVIFLGVVLNLNAQHWNTSGNDVSSGEWFGADPNSSEPVSFEHQADDPASYFEWHTTNGSLLERMRLTRIGWLGLNIAAPEMMFHVDGGGMLSTGTTGTNPDLGMGTRFMWIPDAGAIRAGFAQGNEWDAGFVGLHSAAFGIQHTASGENSFAGGENNDVTTLNAAAFGHNNVTGSLSMAGREGIGAFMAGRANYVVGDAAIALGLNNSVEHQAGVALGQNCTVEGLAALAQGFQSESLGWYSIAMGYQAIATEDYSIMLGTGVNDIEESFKVGFWTLGDILFAGPGASGGPLSGVGIGGIDEPSERLDVDGTARLRQMPNVVNPDVIVTGVVADAVGDYILNFTDLGDLGIQCDWEVVNTNDVATGYPGSCADDQVLIGTATEPTGDPKVFMTKDYSGITLLVHSDAGLDVVETAGDFIAENSMATNTGVRGSAIRSDRVNFGVDGLARDAVVDNFGVRGRAMDGRINFGVRGESSLADTENYGVYGSARGSEEDPPVNNVGVYGEAFLGSVRNNIGGYFTACGGNRNIGVYAEVCDTVADLAGYFVGNIATTQPAINLSDESIKSDMTEIIDPLEIISELNPLQYHYNTASFPHLNLKSSMSYGFSAQQVQGVLPSVVQEITHPAKFDTAGVMITPEEDLLGIRYQEFIAILTAGIKEQQVQIAEQAQTIDGLQQSLNNQNDLITQLMDQMEALTNQVNDCCGGGFKFSPSDDQHGNLDEKAAPGGNVLEQNVPNPFRSQTTIAYMLETGGKVLLNVYDKAGKILTTLEESEQQAGTYRYEWDASGLPAGLYHYALYVDGELLVKKANKLQD